MEPEVDAPPIAPDIVIREATVDDIARVAEIRTIGWQTAYRGIMADEILDGLDVDHEAERWRGFMADFGANGEHLDVAVANGSVVGYVLVGPLRTSTTEPTRPGSGGELIALYVDPAWWGTDVGQALLDRAEVELRDRGHSWAALWTLAANGRARRFYERRGWSPDGSEAIHYGAPAVQYQKDLC